jgi:hypothetical protein
MTETFFEKAGRLDRIISAGPTKCDYSRDLASLLSVDALRTYFFQKITDPEWLEKLDNAGAFKSAPNPTENPEEGTVAFPLWVEGEYLKKIASNSSLEENIVKILIALPRTDNPRVSEAILEIALKLQPSFAVRLIPRSIDAIRSKYLLRIHMKAGELVSYLARHGQTDAAISLARAALEIVEETPKTSGAEDKTPFHNLREPLGRVDIWGYEQILTKNIPDLVSAAGLSALSLLCDLLDRAILLSDKRGSERRPEDLSYIWRPAIEDNQQNLNMGLKPLLVTAVRSASEQLAEERQVPTAILVNELDRRGASWRVFQRLALHLVRTRPEEAIEEIKNRLLHPERFEISDLRHEYFLLQQMCFGYLSPEEQSTVLAWIKNGPNQATVDQISEAYVQFAGRDVTEEDKENVVLSWKRDRVAPLKSYLSPEWKASNPKLFPDDIEEMHPEFPSYHVRTWGPGGGDARSELQSKTPSETVKYLNDRKPSGDVFRDSSPEAIGLELTNLISANPALYAARASDFTGLRDPTHAIAVVQGFQFAVTKQNVFEWPEVVRFCAWATGGSETLAYADGQNVATKRSWLGTAVARLLSDGFASENNPVPIGLRGLAWEAIEPVTRDPDPTPEREQEYSKRKIDVEAAKQRSKTRFDPFMVAINSARGVAIEAVVRYAIWLRKNSSAMGNDAPVAQGFTAMPEVQEVLDRHLQRNTDPSIAVRTVYGHRLPWLQLLDPKWTEANVGRIFPTNDNALWHAAWDTYISYSAAYDNVFDLLRPYYAFATEQIGRHDHLWEGPQPPDFSLSQHLLTFYWRGKMDVKDSILTDFYSNASGELAAHALSFIGRALRDTPGSASREVLNRLVMLWHERLAAASRDPVKGGQELKEFGWWFVSNQMGDEWSVAQLIEVLRIAETIDPDFMVVDELARISTSMPRQCVDALSMIVRGDKKGWAILGWADKARQIMTAAMKSGDATARREAEDLINYLGSQGNFDFGTLLHG